MININIKRKNKKKIPYYMSNELSPREKEVYFELAQGKTRKEMADSLCISVSTIRTHCNVIYSKLCLKNQAEVMKHYFKKQNKSDK